MSYNGASWCLTGYKEDWDVSTAAQDSSHIAMR